MSTGTEITHPLGEENPLAVSAIGDQPAVDTYAGKVHVEWDPTAAVTPIGQLPFFIEYLKIGGLFEPDLFDLDAQ